MRHRSTTSCRAADVPGDAHGPTIGELADYLVLRHDSVVGLADRGAAAGLVTRHPDPERHGTVRLSLTSLGRARLDALAGCHQEELARLAPTMKALWHALNECPAAQPGAADPGPVRAR